MLHETPVLRISSQNKLIEPILIEDFFWQVSRIDDIALSMTFELYFDMKWNESRFVVNETSEKWDADGSGMTTRCKKDQKTSYQA